MMNKRVALSWSGGKDSCMALHELDRQNEHVVCLITTVPKETGKTFAHDEKIERIDVQAKSLGIPVEFIHCTYDTYNEDFIHYLSVLKEKYNLDAVAYGDLYIKGHREWGENIAKKAQLEAIYPLWTEPSAMKQALKKFVSTGYKAEVIRVREDMLSKEWIGRQLDDRFIKDICQKNVCPMGESGEYHTFVYDGPLFKYAVKC